VNMDKVAGMAGRRRKVIAFSLPEDVINGLKDLAQREYRAVSREAERAIAHHLAQAKSGASHD
jgi:hypothetical protein